MVEEGVGGGGCGGEADDVPKDGPLLNGLPFGGERERGCWA